MIGIIYGALGCLAQTDMKRLIAFSRSRHMGFTMLGIATLTDFGLNAAVMGMVAHGLITGMLFFLAGSVKERYHTLEITRLGGLLVQAPRMGWILGFCAMASLGLPGLAGFWGEFPAILAVVPAGRGAAGARLFRTYMVVAAVGTVFAAGYLLWLLQRTAFGTPKEEWEGHEFHDVEPPEWLAWVPLLVAHRRPRHLPELRVRGHRRRACRPRSPPSAAGRRLMASIARVRRRPSIDYHALAPEIVLAGTFVVRRSLVDLLSASGSGRCSARSPASGCSAALVPVLTLAVDDAACARMFGGGYVVDDFALALKALFLVAGYVVVLLSTNYVAEGDYWEGEYYLMLLASMLGMVVMASSRDLVAHLRRPRAAVDPGLHARHVAQARPQVATRRG